MNLYSCTNISININDLSLGDDEKIIIDKWASFTIKERGIYTIEGANRAGKSILIKMIMGILPPNVEGNEVSRTVINNIPKEINSINDAFANGLVAVFQDDALIPTMTILEQIKLRHTPAPKLINYFHNFGYRLSKKISGKFEYQMPIDGIAETIEHDAHEKLKRAFPEKIVEEKCKELLRQFPNLKEDILYKYPHQLSGGTLAKIKIINAQLSANLKILFLDEALNAVAKNDCDEIIEQIKNWAEEKDITVIVVTHKQDEIFKWQPKGRYIIQDKKIIEKGSTEYDALDYGIQTKNDFIIKYYSIEKAKKFLNESDSPFLVLIDEAVKNLPPTNEILEYIGKKEKKIIYLKIDEQKKSLNEFSKIIPDVISYIPKVDGTILIVGGGVMLNFGAFIAATLHRGLVPHILVPTTVMAIADVAIGSKASLNVEITKSDISQKHILGAYTNPSSVIMDVDFIKALSNLEKKIGLSECLKHGLLQDINLYNQTLDLINNPEPNSDEIFKVALRTQELKSRTLINDPFETNYGRILLYGHLHAHSLERLSDLEIAHGLSVYWGIALDLKLSLNTEQANQVIEAITKSELSHKFKTILSGVKGEGHFLNKLNAIYNSDNKIQHYKSQDKFNILKVTSVAEYKRIGCELKSLSVDWHTIKKEINELMNLLTA